MSLGVTNYTLGETATNRYDQLWPVRGLNYQMYVRANAGTSTTGPWTAVASAIAKPQTAPAPGNVQISSTATGIDVTWIAPTGSNSDSIIEYNVLVWDEATPCSLVQGYAFGSSPAHM